MFATHVHLQPLPSHSGRPGWEIAATAAAVCLAVLLVTLSRLRLRARAVAVHE